MEENLTLSEQFVPHLSEAEAGAYSPLVLAFLGDSVYERAVRTAIVLKGNAKVNMLNRKKNRYVKAAAQSKAMDLLEPMLTEKEESIYRRGRNAKSYTMAKNATMGDYRRATGFEALMGYLFLSGQTERYMELIEKGMAYLDADGQKKTES